MSKTLVIILSETRASELTFDNIKKSIDYCIEKYDDGGDYINTIFNNLNKGIHYYQYDNNRINKVIDYILSYNPNIDYLYIF